MLSRYHALMDIKPAQLPQIAKNQKISDYYGQNTFNLKTMQLMLSEPTFAAFMAWIQEGRQINTEQADELAAAMKDWAIEKDATHYTHWFQPMTGLTAEKHDAFISHSGPGQVIEKFKGSNLIQGEPDASSFPSGGIRTTFEARGYTAWDPTSPAFLIESEMSKTLCIPSIFISYHGHALDKKLPLLRSDDAINKAACKLLALFGRNAGKVFSTVGAEQEYFLIDSRFFKLRPDLLMTGRTLVGAGSPKHQQLEDQYFGPVKPRILNYMADVGIQAAKLGIPLKTRHNEVAPGQFEFAPIFEESNLAADHNQLLMNIMQRTANRHGFECLLHEKPFAGINGSGKHVNWSLSDDSGTNLLDPGATPHENLFFLTVLMAVLRAVHLHSDLLRASVAAPGNEHRLGANEAPPAIISVFLGELLEDVLNSIEKGRKQTYSAADIMDLGIGRLPKFTKDVADRNRTSPFAFTGSKFEFRAVGSTQNISTPTMVINAIVAESLNHVTEAIKLRKEKTDFDSAVMEVVRDLIVSTKPIRFTGDNYSDSWVEEAAGRGLPNTPSSSQALKAWNAEKNIKLMESLNIMTAQEISARYNIWLENYNTVIEIEANTLFEMVDSAILPAAYQYENLLAQNVSLLTGLQSKNAGFMETAEAIEDHKAHLADIVSRIYYLRKHLAQIKKLVSGTHSMDTEEKSELFFAELRPLMRHIREHVDQLEQVISDQHWPLPKYREMLFVV